ncbi:hypothetical protein CRE_21544 [Caenorhabditis remanei]|uniref:DDHD domain-containing protein n=1 Tax=Caenorhabditis remanei TaxID=31234 RepID=E3NCP4_CAERE|nr:hypothetical protein CRE_21544 [Caenorhabditis remanei]
MDNNFSDANPNNPDVPDVTILSIDDIAHDSRTTGNDSVEQNTENAAEADATDQEVYDGADTVKTAEQEQREASKKWSGEVIEAEPKNYIFVIVPEIKNFKCKEVRWVYKDSDKHIPFNGKDSLLMEIKYRADKGLTLDDEAIEVFKNKMGHVKVKRDPITAGESKPSIENGKLLVLEKMYSVNEDNTRIEAIHWKNDSKEILRGCFFTCDGKVIDAEIADRIVEHLNDFKKTIYEKAKENPNTDLKNSRPGPLRLEDHKVVIEWNSLSFITIKQEDKFPRELNRHFEEADIKDKSVKVEHLVFVVHGVGHDKEHLVRECARDLQKSVDNVKKSGGIFFLPIHWRLKFVHNGHKCDENCNKEYVSKVLNFPGASKFFEEAMLYTCTIHAPQIQKIVIEELNRNYKIFMESRNSKFNGSISIFAHSLGSVISYDILKADIDAFEKEVEGQLKFNIKRFFAVGSPLKRYLELAGKEGEDFRITSAEMEIHNIYHPTDGIAQPLDPERDPVEIPNAQQTSSWIYKIVEAVYNFVKNLVSKKANRQADTDDEEQNSYHIDHVLENEKQLRKVYSHSTYWSHEGVARHLVNSLYKKECTYATIDVPVAEKSSETSKVEEKITENCQEPVTINNQEKGEENSCADPDLIEKVAQRHEPISLDIEAIAADN